MKFKNYFVGSSVKLDCAKGRGDWLKGVTARDAYKFEKDDLG